MTKHKKRSKYISRAEAAEMLDVHPQTISNYVERGLLKTVKRVGSHRFVYVLRDEVEALIPHADEIASQEEAIRKLRETLEEERQLLNEAVEEQRRLLEYKTQSVNYTKQLIEDCYCLMACTKDSEPVKILLRILMGENARDVAEQSGHSWFMLSKVCRNALETLRRLPDYEEMCVQRDKAISDYNNMVAAYDSLCEQYELLQTLYQEATGKKPMKEEKPP